ncbi:hypothetical protein BDV93DRAFT_525140 [Ceratobasidium sp. AG-I]|nr:hypothetical protein BDV93DRAFT_525140 [Ceratobasidium sp. AG-I]
MTPSFRTPNIQHEYLLIVSVWFCEDAIERFVARFLVQLAPGGGNGLQRFEDAINDPPSFGSNPEVP